MRHRKHTQPRCCEHHHLLYWTLHVQHYHCESWAVGCSAAPAPIHPAVRLNSDNLLLLREAFRMTPQAGDSHLLSRHSLLGRGQLVLPGVCHRDGASADGAPVFLRRAVWLPCVRELGQVSLRVSAGCLSDCPLSLSSGRCLLGCWAAPTVELCWLCISVKKWNSCKKDKNKKNPDFSSCLTCLFFFAILASQLTHQIPHIICTFPIGGTYWMSKHWIMSN